jgi:hypothetical protein
MFHLMPEEKIVLLLSRLNPSEEIINSVKGILEDTSHSLDCSKLLKRASENGVISLLYTNLSGLKLVPDDVMNKLKNSYLSVIKSNVRNAEEMKGILKALKEKDIDAIPLKGALASEIIFGDPGIYPTTDIDILVRPSDLHKTDKVLTDTGYRKTEGVSYRDLLASHYHFLYQKEKHYVEVHWNLVKRYFDIPPDFWWDETIKIKYEELDVYLLSPEKYIMYAVFRLFDHGFRPLKFLVFIDAIIERYRKEIDWDKLQIFLRRYKMERLVLFTFKILNNLLEVEVPLTIKNKKLIGYELFKRQVVSGIFQEVKRLHLRMFSYTLLLDTPADFLKVLTKRFFPEAGEIRLRYGIPYKSKKVYAYYLLNPFLVLLKSKK